MKKLLGISLLILTTMAITKAEELKVGMKATSWQLEDLMGKKHSMESWEGKVILISYLDPDSSDVNEHLNKALTQAIQNKVITIDKCVSMGILDCKSTWKPNSLIRMFAKSKMEELKKSNSSILFDYKATVRKQWGFAKDSSNLVILDKNRICRALVKGRVSETQLPSLINLVKKLQYQ